MTYRGCYSTKFVKCLLYRIYIETHKIFEVMISWPVVVSKLCIYNINYIKRTNVSSKDLLVCIKNFKSSVLAT